MSRIDDGGAKTNKNIFNFEKRRAWVFLPKIDQSGTFDRAPCSCILTRTPIYSV